MRRDEKADRYFRNFLAYVEGGHARREARERRRKRRESVMTVMLSTLAASLGLFVLVVLIVGLAGNPLARWSEPQTVMVHGSDINGTEWYYLSSDEDKRGSIPLPTAKIYLPSRECIVLWMVGLLLTLPAVLRLRFTWSVVLSLALLMSTAVISTLIFALLWLGCFPAFGR
jgi:hypothetical protein